MDSHELLIRRRILVNHVEDLVTMERMIASAKATDAYSGYLAGLDLAPFTAEVKRVTGRLVAVQLVIEELGIEE
tara:strand:- start:287 stop:508 length:222 start_codon:yes stop_codon:yes gene_type:complete